MSNMSYCRFENTFKDLQDCYMNMDYTASNSESNYRQRLIDLCKDIVSEFGDEAFDDDFDEEDDNWDPDAAYDNDRDLNLEFTTE